LVGSSILSPGTIFSHPGGAEHGAKGKLATRIATYQSKDPEHAKTFDALRHVGNVGGHEGRNQRETIVDAFEILEDALHQLYSGHKTRIEKLKDKIIARKRK
jgi:hypothetical protein